MGIFDFWKKKVSSPEEIEKNEDIEEESEDNTTEKSNYTIDPRLNEQDMHQLAEDSPVLRFMNKMLEEIKKEKEYFKDSWKSTEKERDDWRDKYYRLLTGKREILKESRETSNIHEIQPLPENMQSPPEKILSLMKRLKKPTTVKEIAGLMSKSNSRTNDYMLQLMAMNKIMRFKDGKKQRYRLVEEGDTNGNNN